MINGSIFSQFFFVCLRSLYVGTQIILFDLDMNKVFEIKVLGFGGENEILKKCSFLEINSTFYPDVILLF